MAFTLTNFQTANEILKQESTIKILSFGCDKIDFLMGRALLLKGIVEIYGESGVGKTQLCMQIAIEYCYTNIINKRSKKILYISTDIFPIKRLRQLVEHLHLQNIDDILNCILVQNINSFNELEKLFNEERKKFHTKHIELIIIDSVAPLFWDNFNELENSKRTDNISKLSYLLHKSNRTKRIDSELITGVGIICTNEIRTDILSH
ncbi:hypothetical protein HZS_1916, partial [Henneguya salminicola]